MPWYSRTYTTLKGTLFDVVLLMWVNGRLLFLGTFCQGRRFDSVHQHCGTLTILQRQLNSHAVLHVLRMVGSHRLDPTSY